MGVVFIEGAPINGAREANAILEKIVPNKYEQKVVKYTIQNITNLLIRSTYCAYTKSTCYYSIVESVELATKYSMLRLVFVHTDIIKAINKESKKVAMSLYLNGLLCEDIDTINGKIDKFTMAAQKRIDANKRRHKPSGKSLHLRF